MKASERIAAGDFAYRAPVSGWEESQRLAIAFNHMADRLVDAHRNLERRVEERTTELQRSNEHFDRIVSTVPGMLYDYVVLPEGGRFLYVSPKCQDLLEVDAAALLEDANAFWRLVCPDDLARLQAEEADAQAAGGHLHAEVRVIVPSGREKWIEISSLPGAARFSETAVRSGIVMDITARKAAEMALELLNVTLERRVAEAVDENRQKELLLIQQSRLAAMGEMIHNIAHQWRQPLSALNMLIYNIRDAYEFQELDQAFLNAAVAKATTLTQKMSTTIDDFRNFFKPNKEMAYFNVLHCVNEVHGILGAGLGSHGIQWTCEVDGGIAAYGYGNEFSQVLLNLVNNAREAILAHHVEHGRITVRAGCVGEWVELTVGDNGGGIPDDILPKVFDPYFTTKEKGSGIGLYMSKMIVEGHMGGRVFAHNSGDGAEFVVTIPRGAGKDGQNAVKQPSAPKIGA
jgi:PAS domain S-box-containing protein